MDLRVTPHQMLERSISQARRQFDVLARLQAQTATGKRINAPSDDPLSLVSVIGGRATTSRLDACLDNIREARTQLNMSVSTLQEAGNVLTRAKQIAIEGSHANQDQTSREALATEVDQLISRLLALANTQSGGRYLYSGTATLTQPFVVAGTDAQGRPTGVVYQGSEDRVRIDVSQRLPMTVIHPGSEVFQSGQGGSAGDAFQVLIALRDELRNTGGLSDHDLAIALSARIADIERIHTGTLRIVGEQSAHLQHLDAIENRARDVQLSVKTYMSELEDADLTELVVKLQAQENLFRATLAVITQSSGLSLLDFLD